MEMSDAGNRLTFPIKTDVHLKSEEESVQLLATSCTILATQTNVTQKKNIEDNGNYHLELTYKKHYLENIFQLLIDAKRGLIIDQHFYLF